MTSDIRLRIAFPSDADACATIYAPYVSNTTVSLEFQPPSPDDMHTRIEKALEHHVWLTACLGSVPVGYAYANAHRWRDAYRWSAEVSVYLGAGHQRRGIGGRLYRALLTLLERQGYVNAYAGIVLPNVESVAFHEAMGFEQVGIYRGVGYKLGAWRDVGWWAKRLTEGAENPPEPRPISHLSEDAIATLLADA